MSLAQRGARGTRAIDGSDRCDTQRLFCLRASLLLPLLLRRPRCLRPALELNYVV